MIVIHVEYTNTGIDKFPIEVAYLNSHTNERKSYIIKPIEYWKDSESHPKVSYPTFNDAVLSGSSCAAVCKSLNYSLMGMKVYTVNAIETIYLLNMLYSACGDTPSYEVESLSTIIPDDQFIQYEKFVIDLQYKSLCPHEICDYIMAFLNKP